MADKEQATPGGGVGATLTSLTTDSLPDSKSKEMSTTEITTETPHTNKRPTVAYEKTENVKEKRSRSNEETTNVPISTPYIAPVPPEFRFNKLLMDIENSITDAELGKLKAMLTGDELFGDGTLMEVKTASELFKIMRNRQYITRENILWLQGILRILKRPDLIIRTIDWSRRYGNIIHFREAPEPVNGYLNARFHVEGMDFPKFDVKTLHDIRATVSNLVDVPERFVIIAGVEPSSSFVVTLMMPNMYIDILKEILTTSNKIEELNKMGVDVVCIGDEMFNVNGVAGGEVVETDQQMKFMTVYKQLKTKSKLLEDSEKEYLKLSREVDAMTVPRLTWLTFKSIFPNVPEDQADTTHRMQSPASLSSQSALVEFHEALQLVIQHGYDRKLIERLLNANSSIVSSRIRDNYCVKTQQMKLTIHDLQTMVVPMHLELAKYKFYHQVNIQELEKNMQTLMNVMETTVKSELSPAGVDFLKKISSLLRPSERQMLQKKYALDPKENPTLKRDQSLLLECIFDKEVERAHGEFNFIQFVADCLKQVGRDDLIRVFLEEMMKDREQEIRDQLNAKRSKQQSKEVPSQQKAGPSVPNTELANLIKQVTEMNRKVTDIHETIQSTKRDFSMGYGSMKYSDPIYH